MGQAGHRMVNQHTQENDKIDLSIRTSKEIIDRVGLFGIKY